jgi:hypothetical protein
MTSAKEVRRCARRETVGVELNLGLHWSRPKQLAASRFCNDFDRCDR